MALTFFDLTLNYYITLSSPNSCLTRIKDSVPKAVKNKIKEECWSLFNDPRTPKGVKQCILNTMLTKTHSE
jgi:hypothetical protein